ncbi:hypothetical protein BZG36_00990 [Bifiguratus adelaidae]|uniref:Dynein light intermediate chain n=1 Tax=Bifiguratus adelaidae TaxID=1938954 RepID=A0A261Y6C6_9FUNG|nr:hypothetical protein BZG36_00990 [Bifiguratus adelaidae]
MIVAQHTWRTRTTTAATLSALTAGAWATMRTAHCDGMVMAIISSITYTFYIIPLAAFASSPRFDTPSSKTYLHTGELSFGTVLGFCTGYLIKKVGKLFAMAVGVGFIFLQYLSQKGYITVHWDRMETAYVGVSSKEGRKNAWNRLVGFLTYNIQFKAAFTAGFVLQSVATTKMVPCKTVVFLGDAHAGKKTLQAQFKMRNTAYETEGTAGGRDVSATSAVLPNGSQHDAQEDLALCFDYADIRDDENEDLVARLNLYSLSLPHPKYTPLLRLALTPATLADALVVIVMDWSKPWSFIESLERWMAVLKEQMHHVAMQDDQRVLHELRERVERDVQTYTEPNARDRSTNNSANGLSSNLLSTTTNADQVILPLGPGCLTQNLGVPVAVVCSKSDMQAHLERTLDYKEDQFDYIQQTLRTICLAYGAALFYTTVAQPQTMHTFRQYILYRLLNTPTHPYSFTTRAQVVDRDNVFVPTGWDSWGKIKVIGERFDCQNAFRGWNFDMGLEADNDNSETRAGSLRTIWQQVVPNPYDGRGAQDVQTLIVPEDEQAFLERHYENLQKMGDTGFGHRSTGTASTGDTVIPSLVGPMDISSASLHLTHMANTDKESDADTDISARLTRLSRATEATLSRSSGRMTSPTSEERSPLSNLTTSAVSNGSPSSPGPSQNEVLANFFQSLLYKKNASNGGLESSLPASELVDRDRSGRSRRDVQRELEKLRGRTDAP